MKSAKNTNSALLHCGHSAERITRARLTTGGQPGRLHREGRMACEGLGQSPLPLRGPACIAGKLGLGEKQSYQSQLLRQPLKRGQGSSSFTAHALGCAQRRRCPQGFTASTAAPRCHRVPFCVPRCRSGSGEGRGARACRSREGRPGCLAQSTAQASGRGRFQDPLSTSGTRDS